MWTDHGSCMQDCTTERRSIKLVAKFQTILGILLGSPTMERRSIRLVAIFPAIRVSWPSQYKKNTTARDVLTNESFQAELPSQCKHEIIVRELLTNHCLQDSTHDNKKWNYCTISINKSWFPGIGIHQACCHIPNHQWYSEVQPHDGTASIRLVATFRTMLGILAFTCQK